MLKEALPPLLASNDKLQQGAHHAGDRKKCRTVYGSGNIRDQRLRSGIHIPLSFIRSPTAVRRNGFYLAGGNTQPPTGAETLDLYCGTGIIGLYGHRIQKLLIGRKWLCRESN